MKGEPFTPVRQLEIPELEVLAREIGVVLQAQHGRHAVRVAEPGDVLGVRVLPDEEVRPDDADRGALGADRRDAAPEHAYPSIVPRRMSWRVAEPSVSSICFAQR